MTAHHMLSVTISDMFENEICATYPRNANLDAIVTGLSYDSRSVQPGDIFFCIPGAQFDGCRFAADAISAGARVLVAEHPIELDSSTAAVTQIIVDDARKALASSASRFYGEPSRKLAIAGITGTNGKTTTTYLLEWILSHAGKTTGVIGTVETRIGEKKLPSKHTTPESLDLQRLFADMVTAGVSDVAMEVSSHAIALSRTFSTVFHTVAFSNLTQDHLDYHKTLEEYFEAKAKLFTDYEVSHRVICIDDPWGRSLAERCHEAGHTVITTSIERDATFTARDIELTSTDTRFTLVYGGAQYAVSIPIIGKFNIENALLALACATTHGVSLDDAISALALAPQTPGRLERVGKDAPFGVFVDYAHTPDALEKAVGTLKEVTENNVIVVFGCGGDRDRAKRPLMGQAALLGDVAIVTSDNPRSEDPDVIIEEILGGMEGANDRVYSRPDRREAIALAFTLAREGDSVLIAGKGHEDYQLVGDRVLHFDDREVAAEELAKVC